MPYIETDPGWKQHLQPDEELCPVSKVVYSNGTHKLAWGVASLLATVMIAISGFIAIKVVDLGERMVRVETKMEALAGER